LKLSRPKFSQKVPSPLPKARKEVIKLRQEKDGPKEDWFVLSTPETAKDWIPNLPNDLTDVIRSYQLDDDRVAFTSSGTTLPFTS